MLQKVIIHPRINQRHPEISSEDVVDAWNSSILSARRIDKANEERVAVGFDSGGRTLEMIAVLQRDGWFVYHAMTPPSNNTFEELGLTMKGDMR